MNFFVRGRIAFDNSNYNSTSFDVVFDKDYEATILCKDFPKFYMTIYLYDINDIIIKSSMKSIDYRFIDNDTIRVDSIDNLSFWMEIDIQMLIEECYK